MNNLIILKRIKQAIKYISPPFLVDILKLIKVKTRLNSDWEYMPQGWSAQKTDPRIKGWNDESILRTYQNNWVQYKQSLENTSPMGVSPEAEPGALASVIEHNILMNYAYALHYAARGQSSLSMLDWGGGLGHYFLISRAILPEVPIEYSCKDVPLLADEGKRLLPEAHFYSDETCLQSRYDFVLASASLHYSPDWKRTLAGLSLAAKRALFVTQLPIVDHAASFVFVQRPYAFGYTTEYLGWCLNRAEFLEACRDNGLELVREFLVGHRPPIANAPEQCEYRGFLFKPDQS